MRELVILWILSTMNGLAPAHRVHFEREAMESYVQADARYRKVAEDAVDEAMVVRPLFGGRHGRIGTAMMTVTLWFMESGFRRDIDLGTSRVRLRHTGLNDFGRSWCMGQINLGSKRVLDPDHPGMWLDTSNTLTPQGWSGPELVADRRKCAHVTIETLRQSMLACRSLPMNQRLAAYAVGRCDSEEGKRLSEVRMRLFFRVNGKGRPDVTDNDILEEMKRDAQHPEQPDATTLGAGEVAAAEGLP